MRSLAGVGTSLEWFVNNIWCQRETKAARKELYAGINQAVARSAPGANRLLFLPLSGGHLLSYEAGGGFMGLSLSHSREDMARAVMEGIAFELRWALEEVQNTGIEFTQLRMVGGAAESPIWPQIVADVTGLPVYLPNVKQAAGYGAAILAGVGASLIVDSETGFQALHGSETCLEPDSNNRELYTGLFDRYWKLFNFLRQW
jgi:xylulokinase